MSKWLSNSAVLQNIFLSAELAMQGTCTTKLSARLLPVRSAVLCQCFHHLKVLMHACTPRQTHASRTITSCSSNSSSCQSTHAPLLSKHTLLVRQIRATNQGTKVTLCQC